jgi:hypothetical protein
MDDQDKNDIEYYGDESIASYHGIVPNWLKFNYIFWLAWGVVWFYFFWNGSYGYFDRGYWYQLQEAAKTTFPMDSDQKIEQSPISSESSS